MLTPTQRRPMEAKQVTPEQAVEKAKWICECGKETDQPTGPHVEFKRKCECGKELKRLIDPLGVEYHYVNAPEWFQTEFNEQQQKLAQLDHSFKQTSFNLEIQRRQLADNFDRIKDNQQKMNNIIEAGVRRMKLHKDQSRNWGYNPNLKSFIGFEKGQKPK